MATKNMRENKNFRIFLRAVLLMLLPNVCLGAPSFNPKQSWQESVNDNLPILASSCNPATGRCWGLLPVADSDLDDYTADIAQNSDYGRPQVIHVRDVEREPSAAAELWRNAGAAETAAETRGTLLHSNNNQLPMTNNRLAKKDVFASRGWGAGGMPFSVLYMSPRAHSPSSNSDPIKSADSSRRNSESSTTPSASTVRTNQSNNRVSSRNGSYNLPRRHYSIIPQLFVSYGWGPSGK